MKILALVKLRVHLERNGWRTESSGAWGNVGWYAYKPSNCATHCATNERPPQIVLAPFELDGHRSVSVDLTADAGGMWLKLQAYSVPLGEAMAKLPMVERILCAAWEAARAASPTEGGSDG